MDDATLFKDHTILGAILALVIPLSFGLIRLDRGNKFRQISLFGFTLILLTCLVVTFSRAAWVSIIPALLLFLILFFKLRFKYVLMLVGFGLFYLFSNLDVILMDLEHNKVAGSDDVIENAESISNISTDPSNLERINRWACAIEMWKDKPYFGWGPGTYMFEYAPFQLRGNYTAISTNFGDVGNAHSEYLGPLAETGMLGMLLFIAILFLSFHCGFHAYYSTENRTKRILISTSICALSTYYLHGLLNNFWIQIKRQLFFGHLQLS